MIHNLAAISQTRAGAAGATTDDPGLRRRVTDAVFSSGAHKSWAENQASRHGLSFADKLFGFSEATTTSSSGADAIDAIRSPTARLDRKALTVVAQLQEDLGDGKHAVRKPVQRTEGATRDVPSTQLSAATRLEQPQSEAKSAPTPGGGVRGAVQRAYRSSPSYEALAKEHQEELQQRINGLPEESFLEQDEVELGGLSAQFESGPEGVAAIGYDRVGGTSYGKYQLSSRAGTMGRFISFLREEEPDWAKRLEASGAANTRSRRGVMPDTWRQIAKEKPERFEDLQDEFILMTNYQPARQTILEATKIDVSACSPVLQDVLHSTAVQHGPGGASRIFINALQRTGAKPDNVAEEALIEEIYRSRKQNFGSSSWRVRRAVRARLSTEMDMAMDLLKQGTMVADKDA